MPDQIGNQTCTRCVMDTTDPEISFDETGVCNHCNEFDELQRPQILTGEVGAKTLASEITAIKHAGRNRQYDCIIGLSGGVDSSYIAHKVIELGLRPLAVHVDTGWNSELAVRNIETLVESLGIDLYTHVIDWDEMRDLQLAFLRSGVANCDVPQDHAFVAVLFKLAAKKRIRAVISGHNLASESILPEAWGYTSIDSRHILAIHQRFGTKGRLRTYPTYNIFEYGFWWPLVRRIRIIKLLNFMDYRKENAKEFLMQTYGWRDYGGKHYESRFTKFFQSQYLPERFGYDKRKAHLSSLIVSGQLTREAALETLKSPPVHATEAKEDRDFVAKKLGIDHGEMETIMSAPLRTADDYPSNKAMINRLLQLKTAIRRRLHRA